MKKTKLIAVLLTVIAIVVLGMILLPRREENKAAEKGGPTVEILVASADIPAYTELTEEMLEMKSFPEEMVPTGACKQKAELLGATTLVDIVTGEVLVSHHVVSKEESAKRLAMKVEPGKRAMTLEVDDYTGVSHLIKVGDHVDVILVAVQTEEESAAQYAGTMLLQNVEVLALDQAMLAAPMAEDGSCYYGSVTLALTPKQAVETAIAVKVGSVYMTLRGEEDSEIVLMEPFDGWELFEIGHMEEEVRNDTDESPRFENKLDEDESEEEDSEDDSSDEHADDEEEYWEGE